MIIFALTMMICGVLGIALTSALVALFHVRKAEEKSEELE